MKTFTFGPDQIDVLLYALRTTHGLTETQKVIAEKLIAKLK